MSDLPEGIKTVRPRNIAEFMAVQWHGNAGDPAITWLAERFNWRILGAVEHRHGVALRIIGRNAKRYTILQGEWIIALGSNGSLRVVTDKQFKTDYKGVRK